MAAQDRARHGKVSALHRKAQVPGEHGLPKPAVDEVKIDPSGIVGDFNRFRHEERRDDPNMAVLLIPQETLDELNREGWPVRSGDLGENITTVGLAYAAFQPGTRVRVGSALLEVSKACEPCDNLYLLPYVGRERGPEFLRTMLGRRGWFARVLREGRVHAADPIELEPGPPAPTPST